MAYPEALIPGEREIGKADTLNDVVATVEETIAQQRPGEAQFMLAAGSAGIEAATNIVVEQAAREMLFWVYGAVTLMCLITFRSWRAAVVAILPLILTEPRSWPRC